MLGKIIHFTLLLIGVCIHIHIIHSNFTTFKNLYMYTRLRPFQENFFFFFNRSVFFFLHGTFFLKCLEKSEFKVKSLLRMYSNTRNA